MRGAKPPLFQYAIHGMVLIKKAQGQLYLLSLYVCFEIDLIITL